MIIFFSIASSGCGLLYYLKEPKVHKLARQEGYELCHLQSCGPHALSHAFRYLGINKSPFIIGKEIQDLDRTHYREIMSLAHHDFTKITCPPELKNYCRHSGFTITTITDIDDLRTGNIAIILIKGPKFQDWHYICYPKHSLPDILTYFGDDTKFIKAYILTK